MRVLVRAFNLLYLIGFGEHCIERVLSLGSAWQTDFSCFFGQSIWVVLELLLALSSGIVLLFLGAPPRQHVWVDALAVLTSCAMLISTPAYFYDPTRIDRETLVLTMAVTAAVAGCAAVILLDDLRLRQKSTHGGDCLR